MLKSRKKLNLKMWAVWDAYEDRLVGMDRFGETALLFRTRRDADDRTGGSIRIDDLTIIPVTVRRQPHRQRRKG